MVPLLSEESKVPRNEKPNQHSPVGLPKDYPISEQAGVGEGLTVLFEFLQLSSADSQYSVNVPLLSVHNGSLQR